MAARALSTRTDRRPMTTQRGTGRKYSPLNGAPSCAFNLLILKVLCRLQGVGSALSFSAHRDSLMKIQSLAVPSHLCPRLAYIIDLRESAKPQAGVSPLRRNPRCIIVQCWGSECPQGLGRSNWHKTLTNHCISLTETLPLSHV